MFIFAQKNVNKINLSCAIWQYCPYIVLSKNLSTWEIFFFFNIFLIIYRSLWEKAMILFFASKSYLNNSKIWKLRFLNNYPDRQKVWLIWYLIVKFFKGLSVDNSDWNFKNKWFEILILWEPCQIWCFLSEFSDSVQNVAALIPISTTDKVFFTSSHYFFSVF
jgi:hypothetical protein